MVAQASDSSQCRTADRRRERLQISPANLPSLRRHTHTHKQKESESRSVCLFVRSKSVAVVRVCVVRPEKREEHKADDRRPSKHFAAVRLQQFARACATEAHRLRLIVGGGGRRAPNGRRATRRFHQTKLRLSLRPVRV